MIYTISSSVSCCDFLAKKWIKETQNDPWGLAKLLIILPTNRAVKTLREAFLRQEKNLLLPQIVSFANLDAFNIAMPEPIDALERQFILSKLIKQKQSMSEEKAFSLASSLAELIDEMHYYDVSFEKLQEIAPDNFASHWQETLSFLQIIQTFWNDILAQRKQMDPSLYQIRQVESLLALWQKKPPLEKVCALGFTGGLPIVEKFLKAVNGLPQSEIYIPDLDLLLPQDVWDNLNETHPMFYLKHLLDFMQINRNDVKPLNLFSDRFQLASMALLPASYSNLWQNDISVKTDDKLKLIECETTQSEALEIACLLRECLETPQKTAMLVTSDRNLARRVKTQMQKWDILLDDSAGTPLSLTPVGTFLILLAQFATTQKQSDFICLLKHPLCLDGNDITEFRKKVHQAEKKAREKQENLELNLNTNLDSFLSLFINPVLVPFDVLLKTHLEVAQSLAKSADKSGAERLWEKQAGQEASVLLTKALANADMIGDIHPLEYADLLTQILQTVIIRPKYGMHPRLDILGPIEARLQQPDLVIIGGLNEGVFPQKISPNSWINRPMRKMCGLPQPEEKIGVSAQDFIHFLQAKEVVMTRAIKADGAQTIASRWLVRLQAVLEKSHQKLAIGKESFSHLTQQVPLIASATRPSVNPPRQARPKTLSISDISTLIQDPYGIYAKHILKLRKLKSIQEEMNPANFGNAVHSALSQFLELPREDQTKEKLLLLGEQAFQEEGFDTNKNAFFKPKFEKIASWFISAQNQLLPKPIDHLVEQNASLKLLINECEFILKGRADRIDITTQNTASIIDYKTGNPPKKTDVLSYTEPQLPLEALMLSKKAFNNQKTPLLAEKLSYWQVNGKKEAGEITDIIPKDMESFLREQEEKLIDLLTFYDDEKTPYIACLRPRKQHTYNDYEHLERILEWQESEEQTDE